MHRRRGPAWSGWLLLSTTGLAGLALAGAAEARCVNVTTGVEVTSTTGQPTSNQTVVCDTDPPNPTAGTTVITAAPGSTGVSVTIQPGSILAPTTRAIGVVDSSTVLIQGQVITSGINAHGVNLTGAGSTVTNQGTITTTGENGNGLNLSGSTTTPNNTLINSGTITVSGANAAGIQLLTAPNTSITNSGTITVTGTGTVSLPAAGVFFGSGSSGTFTNQAAGTVFSQTAAGVHVDSGNVTVVNAGTITGAAGTAVLFNAANNTLILQTGSVLNGNAATTTATGNTVRLQGTGSEDSSFTGSGFQSLVMEGTNWTLSGTATIAGTTASAVSVTSGTLVVTGTITNVGAGGGTTIAAGATLQLGNNTASGLVTGNIANTGTLVFNRSDNLTYGAVVSGSGSLVKRGAGVLTLAAANTYTGPTVIEQGVLAISNPGNLGTLGNAIIFDGGTLRYLAATTFIGRPVTLRAGGGTVDTNGFNETYSGVASGVGGLVKTGGGTLILTGASTYTGGTTISAGILQLGNGGASGSIVGDIVDNAALVINRSGTLTLGGAISGTGSLTQAGPGTTVLAGASTYTGGTTISAGTLQIGDGGTSGSIAGNITDNAALVFNRSDTVTYGGSISGSGSLTQAGPGTLVLTGNSALGGSTTVAAGTLMIAAGSTLSTSAVLAPGNGSATLQNAGTIVGSVQFGAPASTGTYTLDNSAGGAIQGDFSFQGNGTATFLLAGTLTGNVAGSGDGIFFMEHNGTLGGGIAISGNGQNTVNVLAGRSVNGAATITGAQNSIDNAGAFNQGLVLSGTVANTVINRAGATISQGLSITGDGQNTVSNAGTINNGLTLAGNGTNLITNAAGATVNQGVVASGAGGTTLDNAGIINGAVRLDAGNDSVTNRDGGSIAQVVATAAGSDQFLWTGGNIGGLDMGADNDVATLRGLTAANLTPGLPIDGGPGVDRLTWDSTSGNGVGRYINWELIDLTNNSQLTFSSTLTLGDSGTGTGTLSIDATSTVFAGQGAHAIVPFTSGQLVQVINAGTIDLTNGPLAATDSLTITGNYAGQGAARLLLQTVVGADASPSDKLVIAGGTASGSTGIAIANLGGAGAQTTVDGILVVQATSGGTTASGAFALSGRVAAGAYEYVLVRGGVSAGTADNWYLRSTLLLSSAPGATLSPPSEIPPPLPGEPPPVLVPLFRPEVAVYSAAPAVARGMTRAMLGTFHARHGDQAWLRGAPSQGALRGNGGSTAILGDAGSDPRQGGGALPGAWARTFGMSLRQQWGGTTSPQFDGTIFGLQAGLDVAGFEAANLDSRFGLYLGYARADGDVKGFSVGQITTAGKLPMDAYALGYYGTLVGAAGWYVDAVAQVSWVSSRPRTGIATAKINGTGVSASLEGGYPIRLGSAVTLEPQAQLIWQRIWFDDTGDQFSSVAFDTSSALVGRLGVRLQGTFVTDGGRWQPWLQANLWREFSGRDSVLFAGTDAVAARRGTTALELGFGVTAKVAPQVNLYAGGSYTTNLGGRDLRSFAGNAGVRIAW